jgi:hypothetical protein
MLIKLEIQADNEKEIQKIAEALTLLGGSVTPVIEKKVVEKKVAPVKEAPGQIEMKVETVAPKEIKEEAAPEEIKEEAAPDVDFKAIREQIQAQATKLVTEGKQPLAQAVLTEVGAKKISQIAEDQLQYVLEKMRGL